MVKRYFMDAERNGTVSTIEQIDEFKTLIFKNLGMLREGIEDLNSEELKNGAVVWKSIFWKIYTEKPD